MTEKNKSESCDACAQIHYDSMLTEGRDYKLSTKGKIIFGIFGATACGMVAAALPFLAPGVRKICLPYLPATDAQVSNILKILPQQHKGKLVDLGSGDGRIVSTNAQEPTSNSIPGLETFPIGKRGFVVGMAE